MVKAIAKALALVILGLFGCGDDRETEIAPRPSTHPPEPKPRPDPAIDTATAVEDAGAAEGGADAGSATSPLPTGKPILLEFTRDHCLPCEIMAPWMKQLREQHGRLVQIVEINIDRPESKPLGRFFKARSIPTQVYVDRHGREVSRHVGIATEQQMQRTMKRHGFLDDPEGAERSSKHAKKSSTKKKKSRK